MPQPPRSPAPLWFSQKDEPDQMSLDGERLTQRGGEEIPD